ncbi:bifunctional DedA family/phosphatase PAP2 family protein [Pontibacterium sp. N1Y112]|uniref:Bifunctional DedA family/phosphatase PAP2 family protein n=1 Tax=Pontibacterium sinense TaxID=2781979 RepID=A0A8J7FVI3_9GAMM|nr:bifunctional DedA family/phosphatase PAP2 family protein [Pontibacterium sinense]MBE9398115.1 bifunctional DedA family/phosphatase PAP2 family protein [Pontibacterium sinense]
MDDLISWINSYATQSIFIATALLALLESLAFVGILVPGVAILATISWLAGQQALSLPLLLLSGFLGAVAGDWISYILGRYASHWIASLKIMQRHPNWIAEGERFFARYGGLSIFLGRFIGPIRAVIPFIAGSCAMPPARFLVFNLLSAAFWAPVYLIPAYWLGQQAEELKMGWNIWLQLVALVVFIGVLFHAIHHQLTPGKHVYRWLHPFATGAKDLLRTYVFIVLTTLLLILCITFRQLTGVSPLELEVYNQLHPSPEYLHVYAVFATLLGDGIYLIVGSLLTAILLSVHTRARTAVMFLLLMLGVLLLNVAIKHSLGWPRPELGQLLYDSDSFPSGHASSAATLLASWAVLFAHGCCATLKRRIYLAFMLPIVSVALSRVILGVHWPLDVIAGLAEGLLLAAILRWYLGRSKEMPLPTVFRRWLGMGILLLTVGYAALKGTAALSFYTH